MRKVLIPTSLDPIAAAILREHGLEVVQDPKTPLAELARAHADATALIVRSERVDQTVLDALGELRLVVRAGAGYDTIDTKHARRRGVDVMNTPGANANAVAEEVIALILAAYRHVVRGDTTTRAGQWEKSALMGRELTGKTVGIVGLGSIGQLVVKRLAGFEVKVLAYDPVLSEQRAAELELELCALPDLFARADIVSLHIPETEETRGLVNAELLGQMKRGALLVNCARAGVVDEGALRAAKTARQLRYCTDVYPRDEPGPKSVAEIADLMLPHLGASTEEANSAAARRAAEQTVAYFGSGVTTYVVNRALPVGLDARYQVLAYYLTRVARGFLGPGVQPQRIEASYYGQLRQHEDYLLASVVLGLSADFDPLFDHQQATAYLAEKGIAYLSRQVDDSKGYGNSITIDLMESSRRTSNQCSVRGTVAEGVPMVSRINDFERLYFEPTGHSVLVVYCDQPGMLATITQVMASHGINIDDIRSPHDPRTGDSLAALKVNKPVPDAALERILAHPGFRRATAFTI
ncbi:MAG: ACT domain-containing protein [Deltaproteobacteria bacterium]|nr:ACT domain-containing protein [Deltaproteobacteria bacterium]